MISSRTRKLIKYVDSKLKVVTKLEFSEIAMTKFDFRLYEANWMYDNIYLPHEPQDHETLLKLEQSKKPRSPFGL